MYIVQECQGQVAWFLAVGCFTLPKDVGALMPRDKYKKNPREPLRIGGMEIDLNWKTLTLLSLAIVLVVGASTFFFVLNGMWESVQPPSKPSHFSSAISIITPDLPVLENRINILALGVDEREYDTGRSDTIIVVSIPASSSSNENITLISIPRDTMIWLPEVSGYEKINHLYPYQGPEFTTNAVSRLLDIPIAGYVVVNLDGFIGLVDALGGVTVDVGEYPLDYDDPYQDLHIHLQPGVQKLNSEDAMGFVRFREDAEADLGRIKRQQAFIQACLHEFVAKGYDITAWPNLMRQGLAMVTTNLPWDTVWTAGVAILQSDAEAMEKIQLVGDGLYYRGIAYFVLRYEETLELIAEHIFPAKDRERYVREHLAEQWVRDYEWMRAEAYAESLRIWESSFYPGTGDYGTEEGDDLPPIEDDTGDDDGILDDGSGPFVEGDATEGDGLGVDEEDPIFFSEREEEDPDALLDEGEEGEDTDGILGDEDEDWMDNPDDSEEDPGEIEQGEEASEDDSSDDPSGEEEGTEGGG